MTRKDYIIIASALRDVYQAEQKASETLNLHNSCAVQTVDRTANNVAIALGLDNSRFDHDHFMAVVRGEKDINSHPKRG